MIPRAGRDGKRRIDHVCPHGLKADSLGGLFHFTHHAGSRLVIHKFHIGSITVVHRNASCAMHRPAKVGFTRKSGV